ncbi:hypothetical protein KOSB73_460004 [Klebsiella grimontii]|uniref:Uncharacterized protein n=1 Tax=Klebsiella grimontii TaxID=2058152 RepID=A0A285B9X3_9ENTR|nr:hypothetical protein KOSB73_460004 [Klebsiella grimontii]
MISGQCVGYDPDKAAWGPLGKRKISYAKPVTKAGMTVRFVL